MGVNFALMACNARSRFQTPRQLEEGRQIHARLEEEFSCKGEEVARVVREHGALLERLEEESAARARLMLELHKAEGERRRPGGACGASVTLSGDCGGTSRLWEELPGFWALSGPPHEAVEGSVPAPTSYCCLGRRPRRVTWRRAVGAPRSALRDGSCPLALPRGAPPRARREAGPSPQLLAGIAVSGGSSASRGSPVRGLGTPLAAAFPCVPRHYRGVQGGEGRPAGGAGPEGGGRAGPRGPAGEAEPAAAARGPAAGGAGGGERGPLAPEGGGGRGGPGAGSR